jgi:hypothetical protein
MKVRPQESIKGALPWFKLNPVSPRGHPLPPKQTELPLQFPRIAKTPVVAIHKSIQLPNDFRWWLRLTAESALQMLIESAEINCW